MNKWESVKDSMKKNWIYCRKMICLGLLGIPIGAAVALIEVLFGKGLEYSTAIRNSHPYLFIPLLPLAGLLIIWYVKKFSKGEDRGMTMVFQTGLRLKSSSLINKIV